MVVLTAFDWIIVGAEVDVAVYPDVVAIAGGRFVAGVRFVDTLIVADCSWREACIKILVLPLRIFFLKHGHFHH